MSGVTEQVAEQVISNNQSTTAKSKSENGLELLKLLQHEHQMLLALCNKIAAISIDGDYALVRKLLNELQLFFKAHVELKNNKFYSVLRTNDGLESVSVAMAKSMHEKMLFIDRLVDQFALKYSVEEWTEDMKDIFMLELEQIGSAILNKGESEEEHLYPLYSQCEPA